MSSESSPLPPPSPPSPPSHLHTDELDAYARRTLPPARLLAASDHLAACPACREALLGVRGTSSIREAEIFPVKADDVSRSSRPPWDYPELAAAVDDDDDDGDGDGVEHEIPEAELADLARFKARLAALPPREHGPGMTTTLTKGAGGNGRERGRSSWPTRWPSSAAWWTGAGAAAAVVLALASWWGGVWSPGGALRPGATDGGFALRDGGNASGVLVFDAATGQPRSLPSRLPEELGRAVVLALREGRVELPPADPRLPTRRAGVLLADGHGGDGEGAATFTLVRPVGTTVRGTRPRLEWTPRAGAAGYRVTLERRSDRALTVSPPLPASARHWEPEADLTPGEVYQWEVHARRTDDQNDEPLDKTPRPPEPEARFAVLTAERERELTWLEREFGRSRLVMGVAFARAGLRAEAEAQFAALARENPGVEPVRRLAPEGGAVRKSPAERVKSGL